MSQLALPRNHGQSFWRDSLSRRMPEDGSLAARGRDQALGGVASSSAIVAKAMIGGSPHYDPPIQASLETVQGPTRSTLPWRWRTWATTATSCCRSTGAATGPRRS